MKRICIIFGHYNTKTSFCSAIRDTFIQESEKIGNEIALQPSSLETIDLGLFRFVDEELNLHVKTNKGFEKVKNSCEKIRY